eukprot:7380839-Prymnesium_polylepis.1
MHRPEAVLGSAGGVGCDRQELLDQNGARHVLVLRLGRGEDVPLLQVPRHLSEQRYGAATRLVRQRVITPADVRSEAMPQLCASLLRHLRPLRPPCTTSPDQCVSFTMTRSCATRMSTAEAKLPDPSPSRMTASVSAVARRRICICATSCLTASLSTKGAYRLPKLWFPCKWCWHAVLATGAPSRSTGARTRGSGRMSHSPRRAPRLPRGAAL